MRRLLILAIFFQAIFLTCSIFSMQQEELPNESNNSALHGVTLIRNPEKPNEIAITLSPEIYESANALTERINSEFGPFAIEAFREHLFFVPSAFTTQESQDWYVETLISLTSAYGFDRLANPELMSKLNFEISSPFIFNPFIDILKEIYSCETRANEVERLFSFCDTFMNSSEIKTKLTSITSSEASDDGAFPAYFKEEAQGKNRIGSLKNLMIATDIGFSLKYKSNIEAGKDSFMAVRLSKLRTSVTCIAYLLEKLNASQTIALRDQYLNNFLES